MPAFSQTSKDRLQTCHNELQAICNEAIKLYDFTVLCGHRNEGEQNRAYSAGNSKLRYPNSKHNKVPSLAVDLAPYPINYKRSQDWYYLAGLIMTVAYKMRVDGLVQSRLRWGGDWDGDQDFADNKFNDLGHFEIV